MSAGKCEWLIPDAFYPVKDNGDYVSHEAVCILNTGKEDAQIKFTLYFEDRPPVHGFSAICPAERTHHVRLDRIKAENGDILQRFEHLIRVDSVLCITFFCELITLFHIIHYV